MVKPINFDIERKSSTESPYQSLFSSDENSTGPDKPTATVLFVDPVVTTGETTHSSTPRNQWGKVTGE